MYFSIKSSIKYNLLYFEVDMLNNLNIIDIEKNILINFNNEPKNFLLDFKQIIQCNVESWKIVYKLQLFFYKNNYSFILFNINDKLLQSLTDTTIKSSIIFTPTEIEAIDLVLLEELERDLLL